MAARIRLLRAGPDSPNVRAPRGEVHLGELPVPRCDADDRAMVGPRIRRKLMRTKLLYGIKIGVGTVNAMNRRPGLRERKKLQTARTLRDVAIKLFSERGFDDVSIAEIAEEASVSKVTVFNYFPTKEDLLLKPLE
jgi:hypothetical protein